MKIDLALKKSKTQTMERVPTGISGLDFISMGGLPKGRATLIAGTSGSCKTLISLQFLMEGILRFDAPGVFVTFEETPEDIRNNVEELGWPIRKLEEEGAFAFVDASPTLAQTQTILSEDYDFSALIERIEEAVLQVNAKRLVIDSIGTVFSIFSSARIVRREMHRIMATLKKTGNYSRHHGGTNPGIWRDLPL